MYHLWTPFLHKMIISPVPYWGNMVIKWAEFEWKFCYNNVDYNNNYETCYFHYIEALIFFNLITTKSGMYHLWTPLLHKIIISPVPYWGNMVIKWGKFEWKFLYNDVDYIWDMLFSLYWSTKFTLIWFLPNLVCTIYGHHCYIKS